MAGRPRIYEEVDKEMKLEELVRTACDLFGPPYDDREPDMFTRKSIREVGRIMGLSQEKTRRLLIEGGWYSTQETRSVRKLMRQGLKDDEIAKELDIPVKKVSSLKPYKDSRIYGIGTVNAQRNKEYEHDITFSHSTNPANSNLLGKTVWMVYSGRVSRGTWCSPWESSSYSMPWAVSSSQNAFTYRSSFHSCTMVRKKEPWDAIISMVRSLQSFCIRVSST